MIRRRFSVMFSRRFAVMSFRLMLFALCSVLHKVSSVPQGISDKKHNFALCRAIFYLCDNRFRFLCFVISYKKAQKSRPAIKAFCLYTGRPAMPSPISCSESFIYAKFAGCIGLTNSIIRTSDFFVCVNVNIFRYNFASPFFWILHLSGIPA